MVMMRVLAWKPRCVMIRFVNSFERSTLDISTKPVLILPRPLTLGWPTWARPELLESLNRFWPSFSRPAGLEKLAIAIWPSVRVCPLEKTPVIRPSAEIEKVWSVPTGKPSWVVAATLESPASWVSEPKLMVMSKGVAPLAGVTVTLWDLVFRRLPLASKNSALLPVAVLVAMVLPFSVADHSQRAAAPTGAPAPTRARWNLKLSRWLTPRLSKTRSEVFQTGEGPVWPSPTPVTLVVLSPPRSMVSGN